MTLARLLSVLLLSQLGIEATFRATWSGFIAQSRNMNLPVSRQSSACSLSGILNYGTPSQRGVSVYIKEPAKVWAIALGTGASQLSV